MSTHIRHSLSAAEGGTRCRSSRVVFGSDVHGAERESGDPGRPCVTRERFALGPLALATPVLCLVVAIGARRTLAE